MKGMEEMGIQWIGSKEEFRRITNALIPVVEPLEASLKADTPFRGFCSICNSWEPFTISPPTTEWINLRNRILCNRCGFSGRHRASYQAMAASPAWQNGTVLVMEAVTNYYRLLSSRFPRVIGTEYLADDMLPGQIGEFSGQMIRHEDMMNMSFDTNSLDAIYHGDVLEHIPDMVKGLKECYRVLKPGGELVFTVPFYSERETTLIRAEIIDGKRIDHYPPAYHGNPLSNEGVLVFSEPGLNFLDLLSSMGDWSSYAGLAYSVVHGYFSDNHPRRISRCFNVVFKCHKNI